MKNISSMNILKPSTNLSQNNFFGTSFRVFGGLKERIGSSPEILTTLTGKTHQPSELEKISFAVIKLNIPLPQTQKLHTSEHTGLNSCS